MEQWKDIKGYEGSYQVSNEGKIKSLVRKNRSKEIVLKNFLNNGYLSVQLHKQNQQKHMLVHRLVAGAFVKKIKDKNDINHINGIKFDNRAENLEWCNDKENIAHAIKMGFKIVGEKSHFSKLTEQKVVEIRGKYQPKKYTMKMLAEEYGVYPSMICRIIKRQNWKHV